MKEYEENKLIDESLQKFTSINRLQTSNTTILSFFILIRFRVGIYEYVKIQKKTNDFLPEGSQGFIGQIRNNDWIRQLK